MPTDLELLVTKYLKLRKKKRTLEEKLERVEGKIIGLAREQEIRRFQSRSGQLLIVSQAENRFPQIGDQHSLEAEESFWINMPKPCLTPCFALLLKDFPMINAYTFCKNE